MATTPIIQTNGSTSGLGTAGEDREGLIALETITLTDTEVANLGASYVWSLPDVPIGTSPTLNNPTTASPDFDLGAAAFPGSYKIRCVVNGSFTAEVIISVPLPNTGVRIPTFAEELEYTGPGATNTFGWHRTMTVFMRQVDTLLVGINNDLDGAYDHPTAGAGRTILVDAGAVAFTQPVLTSGSPEIFRITGGSNTTLAATIESSDIVFDLARIVQFSTGALTDQRAFYIQAPTYAFVGASVITNAATLAISGAPIEGTNATITNPLALLVEEGTTRLVNTTTENTLEIEQRGAADAINIFLNLSGTAQALVVTESNIGRSTPMIQLTRAANASGGMIDLSNAGSGRALFIDQNGVSDAILINHAGDGEAIDIVLDGTSVVGQAFVVTETAFARSLPMMQLIRDVTATGDVLEITAPGTGFAINVISGDVQLGDDQALWFDDDSDTGILSTSPNNLTLRTNGTNRFTISTVAVNLDLPLLVEPPTQISAGNNLPILRVTGTALTTQAAAEDHEIHFNLNRDVQFTAGAAFTQRAVFIDAPTYSATAAQTIDKATTVSISGPPIEGANMTFTNSYALDIELGDIKLGDDQTIWLDDDADTGIRSSSDDVINLITGNGIRFTVTSTLITAVERFRVAPASNTLPVFSVIGAAQLGLTADTEAQSILLDISSDKQFTAGGAFALQRAVLVDAPTYSATAAQTIDKATTVSISGPPIEGANMTMTETIALDIESGQLVLPLNNDALRPTLAFGLGDTGFFESSNGVIVISLAGVNRFLFSSQLLMTINANGAAMLNETTSATNPTLSPNRSNTTTGIGQNATNEVSIIGNSIELARFAQPGSLVTQAVQTSGTPTLFTLTGAAHTTLTAATEATDVNFNLARTVEFSTGALATQRAMRIQAPTYAFVVLFLRHQGLL